MFIFKLLRKIRLIPPKDDFVLDQCTHHVHTWETVRIEPQPRIEDCETVMLPVTLPHIETPDDEDTHKTRKMYKVWTRTNGGRSAEKHIIFNDGSRFVCEP